MITKNSFRLLLSFMVFLWILYLFLYINPFFDLYSLLPEELSSWSRSNDSKDIGYLELSYYFICFVAIVISFIGLFLFKAWARALNLVLTVGMPFVDMIIGSPVVLSSIEYGVGTYLTALDGLIVGITYFSNGREYFEKE